MLSGCAVMCPRPAFRRWVHALSQLGLCWLLVAGLLVQSPALVFGQLARAIQLSNLPSEEERPTESTEIPGDGLLAVSQGRRTPHSFATPQPAIQLPLVRSSASAVTRPRTGRHLISRDVRLGAGSPLRC
jgi:hypothetical protein